MTSATSEPSVNKCRNNRRQSRRSAFTLIELLVVIGIIIVLVGLLLPMVMKALTASKRTRVASDLNAISAALSEYKDKFGDFPRIIYFANANTAALNGTGSGAEVLGKALMGLGAASGVGTYSYSATTQYYVGQVVVASNKQQFSALRNCIGVDPTTAASPPTWIRVTVGTTDATGVLGGGFDGADGPGFRVRTGGFGDVSGPYLQPDKFKTRGLAIVDYFGNPILYFPGNPAKPAVTMNDASGSFNAGSNTYVSVPKGITAGVAPTSTTVAPPPSLSFYNYSDNDTKAIQGADINSPSQIMVTFPDTSAAGNGIKVMEAMLGNFSMTGFIDTTKSELAASTAPFLLWSAGPDGVFGPAQASVDTAAFVASGTTSIQLAVKKCDDVTNFTFGQ